MRMQLKLVLTAFLVIACQRESAIKPLSEYESADLQARAYNFQVYPAARFLEKQTELLRKAHFVMAPNATEAPPMAMYDTDAPLDDVAKFYAGKYGYELAANETNNFSSVKPEAYFMSGNLAADAQNIKPILEKLKVPADLARAQGEYRGAYISPAENMPRVNLQRPYFDVANSQTVDRTLILMVRE
jgi:hypothetical protein